MKITFLLPARGRSGGIRVSVEMANKLRERGHDVRIAYFKRNDFFSLEGLRTMAREALIGLTVGKDSDFVQDFKGPVEPFSRLEDLEYARGEVLIAVGVYFIPQLAALKADVIKLRYDHGLPGDVNDPLYRHLSIPINTICVSEGIVPVVERELGHPVLGVVPNGIDTRHFYRDESIPKTSIGTIWATQYEKAPEETLELLAAIRKNLPETPLRVFGRPKRPAQLGRDEYSRYPSEARSRAIYNGSLVWLVTSRSEGFSLPTLEAMACGAVVISSNHMNASKLIEDGKNGFIVEFGDAKRFMEKIRLALGDESLRRRINAEAAKTVKLYDWDSSVDKMEAVLDKLASSFGKTNA